jgi:hypothetical protein
MIDLARAVIVDTLLGSSRRSRLPWLLAIAGVGLAAMRWKAARDMNVPLDLAFKHPLTPVAELRRRFVQP